MPAYGQLEDLELLTVIDQLMNFYRGFPWESRLWATCGHRCSPFRVLVLFGLSSRTKDPLLVETCRKFFQQFPEPGALLEDWYSRRHAWDIVRKGQVPFVESTASTLRALDGVVPRDRESLLQIRGVGEKIVECVVGYGWGGEALPMDGNGCRVFKRLMGVNCLAQQPGATDIRDALKTLLSGRRGWMANRDLAMIDVHEVLRLHGQTVCKRSPKCSRCPVSSCRSRRQEYSVVADAAVTGALWAEWRDLILALPTPNSSTNAEKVHR